MDEYKNMKPMERYRFMKSNNRVCPHCNKTKKLNLFWVKEDNTILPVCRVCDKKIKDMEEINRVLSSINLNNI